MIKPMGAFVFGFMGSRQIFLHNQLYRVIMPAALKEKNFTGNQKGEP